MKDEEWGPWIEHDGRGCPCAGHLVQGVYRNGATATWIAATELCSGREVLARISGVNPLRSRWHWATEGNSVDPSRHIIRYRIRKPRALLDMIERARELDDAPEGPRHVKHKETAK